MDRILIPLFTGLIGLWLGYRLNLGQRVLEKRRHFSSVVKQLRDKVEATHLREFAFANHLAFDATIKHLPELEREVAEVEQHIASRNQKNFASAFDAYKILGQQLGDEQKNAPIKERMLYLLDELLRFTS